MYREGRSKASAFREAWKQYRPGRKNDPRKKRRIKNPVEELMLLNKPRRSKSSRVGRHRLSIFGTRGGYHISRKSRLAPRMAGFSVNPPILKGVIPNIPELLPELVGVLVGFEGVRMLPKYIIPAKWQTGIIVTVSKIVTIIVLSSVAGLVLKKPAIQKAIFVGGLMAVVVDLLEGALPEPAITESVSNIKGVSDMGYQFRPEELTDVGNENDSDEYY
jgi:hypothetical protein